jgi:hypothetical protein
MSLAADARQLLTDLKNVIESTRYGSGDDLQRLKVAVKATLVTLHASGISDTDQVTLRALIKGLIDSYEVGIYDKLAETVTAEGGKA